MNPSRLLILTLTILATLLVDSGQSRGEAAPEQLVEKYESNRKDLVDAEAQKRKILGSLYGINQRMKKINREKSHLTDELFQAQVNVKNIARIIANLEDQIYRQRKQLRRRLRALYKLSGEGYLAILFSRTEPDDLDRTMRFLKIVTENDYRLIQAYRENIASYTAQKKKLRGQVEHLLTIEKSIKSKESMLLAEHQAKSKIVSSLDREKIAKIRALRSIRSQGQALNINDFLAPSIFEQKGQLIGPVAGTVVQDFGLIVDEKYKLNLSHKGWLYETPPDTPIAAIFEGQVVFSETMPGYGPTVVIDHGDHYYSVYAHIARVNIKSGDTIKRGQVIADCGPISNLRRGLYFEIRHFSEPENPASWIRRENENSSIATN